jgi:hypothetical protein
MPVYRIDLGDGTTAFAHVNFGRRAGPLPCVAFDEELKAKCGRMSVALCDHPSGRTLGGKELTCDAPMCERHRTKVGRGVDHCPRHAQQLRLAEMA